MTTPRIKPATYATYRLPSARPGKRPSRFDTTIRLAILRFRDSPLQRSSLITSHPITLSSDPLSSAPLAFSPLAFRRVFSPETGTHRWLSDLAAKQTTEPPVDARDQKPEGGLRGANRRAAGTISLELVTSRTSSGLREARRLASLMSMRGSRRPCRHLKCG